MNSSPIGGDRGLMAAVVDRRLLARIAAGDASAVGDLYDRHAGLLALRLRRAGASRTEAEDILQETFLAVWRGAGSFRGDGPVAAWLWGIASHRLLSLSRTEARARVREAAVAAGAPVRSESDWAALIDARTAVERLDPRLREPLLAVAVKGMTVAEVAVELGLPEGTVKSRIHRARRVLRRAT